MVGKLRTRVFSLIAVLLVMCFALPCALRTEAASDGGNNAWPTYLGNPEHTGQSKFNASQNEGSVEWKYYLRAIAPPPAIGYDGTIYIGDVSGQLVALDQDGSEKWKENFNGSMQYQPAIEDDGTIIIGLTKFFTYNGSAICAVAPNGTILWRYDGLDLRSDLTIGMDGTIYAMVNDYNRIIPQTGEPSPVLIAIHQNGSEAWRHDVTGPRATPAVSPGGLIVYADSSGLTALSATGSPIWSVELDSNDNVNCPVIRDGVIYLIHGLNLHAYDLNGAEMWANELSSASNSPPLALSTGQLIVTSTWTIASYNTNGQLSWQFYVDDPINSPLVAGNDGNVFFAAGNAVFCLSSEGEELWHHTIALSDGDTAISRLVLGDDGRIYAVSDLFSSGGPILYAIGHNDPGWIGSAILITVAVALLAISITIWRLRRTRNK